MKNVDLKNMSKPYIQMNLKVFPLKFKDKTPLVSGGFKSATTDPCQIERWNDTFYRCNIGIATGKVNNIFVVGVDGEKGLESLNLLENKYGKLIAPTVITGKGKHLYFQYPKNIEIKSSVRKIAPSIDIRADGGYVVAPPSIHASGSQYRWENVNLDNLTFPQAPDWLINLLTKNNPIFDLVEDIKNAPEGTRNDTLLHKSIQIQKIAKKENLNMEKVNQEITSAALSSGLPEKEIHNTLKNAITFSDSLDLSDFQELDKSILREKVIIPAPKFNTKLFHDLEDWVCQTAESCNAPTDYVAFSLIAATAACIGLARTISPWHTWNERCCFFMGIVGDPSSRKTPSTNTIKQILHKIEKKRKSEYDKAMLKWDGLNTAYEQQIKNWKKEIKKHPEENLSIPADIQRPEKPQSYRFVFGDTTQESLVQNLRNNITGAIIFRDELFGWLSGMNRYSNGNAEKSFWLETYNGNTYLTDRVKFGEDPVVVNNLLVSIFGTIQPRKLLDAFLGNSEDGLVPRFIWAYPEPVAPAIPKVKHDDKIIENSLEKLSNLLNPYKENAESDKKTLYFSEEAQRIFEQWYLEHLARAQIEENQDEKLGYFLNKGQGCVARLSLLFEYLWWSSKAEQEPQDVSVEALQAAIDLYEHYLFPMVKRVYGVYFAAPYKENARKLAQYIVTNNLLQFTLRDIYYNAPIPSIRDKETCEQATSILIKYGWLRKKSTRQGHTKGRLQYIYEVNPEVFSGM